MDRLPHILTVLLLASAITVASPIGSGGAALAAESGSRESELRRQIDALSGAQRIEFEQKMADGLEAAGVDLKDPQTEAGLARLLGVTKAEIERADADSKGRSAGTIGGAPAVPVLFLFIVAALIFAPGVFNSIGGTIYGYFSEGAAVEGTETFGG
jgi:hypothetical protein